ncbi:MAG: hypothetical protein IJW03_04275 [Clostridia bacterium]|nr:hypothetical protein [Clostridia bacterium]
MNEYSFDKDLLDVGGMMKRTKSYFVSNGGKIIAAITLVIAVVVMFTDITFSGFSSYEFFTTLLLMLLASYLMFFSLEDAGERLGEDSDEYRAAIKRYYAAKGRISAALIPSLREFCTRYSRDELAYRRISLLTEHGYTLEEYEAYISGKEIQKRALRVFRKCEKMCAVTLSPQILLSVNKQSFESELVNPEKRKLLHLVLQLIPSTVCMAFTVSVILSTKEGMTLDGVIDGLFKLTALPIVGLRGYSEGYSYVKNSKIAWIETKARLLEAFLLEEN